ncbi:IS3 family transposase, partial [Kineococcus endophyticus]
MIFAAIADWDEADEYPVTFMCQQLGVSRSGYYAWRARTAAGPSTRHIADEQLCAVIVAIFGALRGNPGRRRVLAQLRAQGVRVGFQRVHRLMQGLKLAGWHPKAWKRTTIGGSDPVPEPDLIGRDFTAQQANTRWCGDITYVKTWDGWAYLATVIDLHSRAVTGSAIDTHMRTDLVVAALQMALVHRRPAPGVIFHADRGAQYTSKQFAQFCDRNGVRRSLGRTGICYDNAVAESFFATYEKELIHTRPWPTVHDLRRATFDWIANYYNSIRRHSTLGY